MAWGGDCHTENATTRVAQRPFLARNDRNVVQLLHIECGAACVIAQHRGHHVILIRVGAGDGVG